MKEDKRHYMVVGVHLILKDGDKVLMARRAGGGYGNGLYNFPCGHVDEGEDLKTALVREAKEEVGVDISESDLHFAGATHYYSNKQSVNFFFVCEKWSGKIENCEPHKCDDLSWFELNNPPHNMVYQTQESLKAFNAGYGFFVEIKES